MKKKALALISGGLDSLLAAKVIMKQGVEVEGLCFVMQFASRDIDKFKNNVETASTASDIPVRFIDISEDFLALIEKPGHGFGANVNPCIDCKIMMLTKAKEIMEKEETSFIITGEVLGERPMSQRKQALNIIEKSSGLKGYLLRPLSAKLLEETVPEEKGVVNREELLDISGRSRTPQYALAEELGVKEFFAPGGGCLLTDPIFGKKMKDLLRGKSMNKDNIDLLKYGRHYRLDEKTKVVVGRDENENEQLEKLKKNEDVLMRFKVHAGPYVLLRGDTKEENLKIAGSMVVSHSKQKGAGPAEVECLRDTENRASFLATAISRDDLEKLRIY